MRLTAAAFIALLALAGSALAQPAGAPPALEPLPPPPPPTPGFDLDPALEPQVTIRRRDGAVIEEFRTPGGRIYMIRVIPENAPPYFLVDETGDGKFSRQDSLDMGVRTPRWVIFSW
jgi:hypothetical protein